MGDSFTSDFLAGGAPGHGEASAGDHLQLTYHLWLVGDQLEHGRAPWRDPYSFRPEAKPLLNLQGWPLGLPFWPLRALFGTIVAWNSLVLLLYAAAGLLACAWLRELGLPRGPALVGGLAFALAPYRANQSVGHLLGPISILLPLALLGFERARRGGWGWLVLAAASLASIPLSGQVHLALGAIPFVCAYGIVRARRARDLVGVVLALTLAIAAGVLVQETSISQSILAGGRSLHAVRHYSAGLGDFVARRKTDTEKYVFLGWLTPIAALAGLGLLWRDGRRGLAWILGLGALVPMLLALGTNLPLYTAVWHAFKPFRYPRVPERLMPIACLCLAALVAFAVARLSERRALLVPAVALALVGADLHARLYGASEPDESNAAYAALGGAAPGRLLELPIFLPDIHYGSVYQYYDIQVRRERPLGYSTLAPVAADDLARRLLPLNCGRAHDPGL
ncbi:MAG: hypothetical protein QOE95_276, partial [Gaiellaceae bacterium]|nr:hypothetical protein [Gaiellaceae bacterium]